MGAGAGRTAAVHAGVRGHFAGCDAGCTHAFCKCMEDARADAKTGAGAIGNGLIIACITFVLFALLACMVERRRPAPLMFTSTPSRCCRRRPLKFIARVNRLSPRAPDIRAARIRARTEFAAEQLAIACIDFVLPPQINLRSKKFAHCTARLAWFVKFFPPAPDELMVSLWYLQRATCLFRFATLHAIFR